MLQINEKRCCSCRRGEAMSLNCGHQRARCSSPDDIWVCSHGGMISTGETEELGEKPAPVPLCPPHVPLVLSRSRTLALAVRFRRLTVWAMARPSKSLLQQNAPEHEGSSPYSQEPAIGPYPEPTESTPDPPGSLPVAGLHRMWTTRVA
jgi:hypothetical protein